MLPHCQASNSDWDCVRGCVLAASSVLAFFFAAYAVACMLPVWMRVRWYGLNILMVGLAATQALVAVFHYALYADAHLLLAVKIIRELQNIIAFAVYARLACESSDKQHAVRRMVWPGLGVLIAFLLAMLVVGMLRKKLDCHDPIWLLVTGSNTVLTVAFTVLAFVVMRDIQQASTIQRQYSQLMGGEQRFLMQKRQQVWILVMVNGICTVLQLGLDATMLFLNKQSCEPQFGDDAMPHVMDMLARLAAYHVPLFATVYVFYFLQRHQYSTSLEVEFSREDSLMTVALDEW